MANDSSDRIIRLKEVLLRTGLSRSTLYRKVALRTFPKQIEISARCIGWRESDLDDWLRNPMAYEQPGNASSGQA
jgi:prophage regulatory protein